MITCFMSYVGVSFVWALTFSVPRGQQYTKQIIKQCVRWEGVWEGSLIKGKRRHQLSQNEIGTLKMHVSSLAYGYYLVKMKLKWTPSQTHVFNTFFNNGHNTKSLDVFSYLRNSCHMTILFYKLLSCLLYLWRSKYFK